MDLDPTDAWLSMLALYTGGRRLDAIALAFAMTPRDLDRGWLVEPTARGPAAIGPFARRPAIPEACVDGQEERSAMGRHL